MPASSQFGFPTVILSRIGGVEIDAVLSEQARYENLVTANPIETGAEITDHVVARPLVHTMEGRVTDTPLSIVASGAAAGAGLVAANNLSDDVSRALGGAAVAGAAAAALGDSKPGLALEKAELLLRLFKTGERFKVITGLSQINPKVYERMVFADLLFTRGPRDGRSQRFQAVLRELLTAETLETEATVAADVAHTAPASRDLGQQPTEVFQGAL